MTTTGNPGSVVDAETFSVRRTIDIAATPEAVWRSVTEPELISRWFGRTVFESGVAAALGSVGTITWPDRDPVPLRVEAVEPGRLVSYRWCNPCLDEPVPAEVDDEHSTVFTFTLEQTSDGTRLTVVESGFETMSRPAEHLESHRGGWNGELDKLVALLDDADARGSAR
ncbi:SRPBCC domain-containing protein [Herbiconiux sp. KACC 21604]|uniref:SRPBCC domain-containing protein n=1 Tax=unclassified Herbiconiux TaxID=2618217 RepID=UPI001490B786|nr:SRPBCC domain-containing protein [Herbiconiux sp. SALV-R1]QJU54201.1 hypothetical protein HL652_11615 [Herbiconiux sp. SALV-R1]WPO85259.1 SRPBCC domain-containing protein [Herbiconiux sp. KACC 21604]